FDGNFPYGGAAPGGFLQKTTKVGSYAPPDPNPFGLFDMQGNAAEWCSDFFSETYYRQSPPADPTGPVAGAQHVLRAGLGSHEGFRCRAAYRNSHFPEYAANWIGFRVVLADGARP